MFVQHKLILIREVEAGASWDSFQHMVRETTLTFDDKKAKKPFMKEELNSLWNILWSQAHDM